MELLRRRALRLLCAALLITSLVPAAALAAPGDGDAAAPAEASAAASGRVAASASDVASDVSDPAASEAGPAPAAPAGDLAAAPAVSALSVSSAASAAPADPAAPDASAASDPAAGAGASSPSIPRRLISSVTVDVRTSARPLLFSLAQDGTVALLPGAHERWIDRIDIPAWARDFYDVLAEAADNDGVDDFLIEDRYFDAAALPELGTTPSPAGSAEGRAVLRAAILEGTGLLPEEEKGAAAQEAYRYLLAVMAAFDRDHGEVFWLSSPVSMGAFTAGDQGDLEIVLFLAGEGEGRARHAAYDDERVIKAAIAQRDADVQAILSELRASGAAAEDVEAVRFLNRWLVEHNQYNTASATGQGGLEDDYPDAWECVSALGGRLGAQGPVCEGYARALKVLCDGLGIPCVLGLEDDYPDAWECVSALGGRLGAQGPVCEGYARALKVLCDGLGIPCVLVDGQALANAASDLRAGHMWNYVQVDGAWYGIDVTWNDPSNDANPNPPYDPRYSEAYFLAGAETPDWQNEPFLTTHPVENRVFTPGTSFVNGPELAAEAYAPKAAPVVGVPVGLAATYGDELGSVALPEPATGETPGAWSWAVADQPVGNVGTRTFRAVFTPEDRTAFAAAAFDVTVAVAPRAVTPTVELAAPVFTWAGHPVTPTVTVRDGDAVVPASEYSVAYRDNDALGTATVVVTDAPGGNYDLGEARATFELVERPTPKLAAADLTKVYDGAAVDPQALLADVTATVEGHEVAGTWSLGAVPEMRAAGSYEVEVRFEPDDAAACLPAATTARVTIERRPATLGVELPTNRLTADDAVPAPTLRVDGLVEGELIAPTVAPAFRGLPARGEVGDHVVEWVNADDVLAAARALPAAANYELSLAGERSWALAVADVTLAPVADPSLRVELRAGLDAAPEGLAATPFQTPEAVEAELLRMAREALPTVADGQIAVWDVALFTTADGGRTWEPADEASFPAEGLEVLLPVPEGSDVDTHWFTAAHMFTAAMAGFQPGDVEPCEAAASAEGVRVTVHGLSPVAVAWGDEPTEEALRAVAMAQTGDRAAPFALALAAALSAALVVVMSRRRVRA